jgi:tryptophan synthase alpha chain
MTMLTTGSAAIGAAFKHAHADGRIAFIPYVVAGYPDAETSVELALAALDAGADLLEIGLPYSDPLADGVTLQHASSAAIAAGATLESSLDVVARVTTARPGKPVIVMGYVNQFMGPSGIDEFARRLAAAGAAGAIVADLTPDEGAPLERAFAANDLALVYLVAPTSTPDRIATIVERSGGFVYCVALNGVTGARSSSPAGLAARVARLGAASGLPVAVGFGVSRPEHVRRVARAGADGVIVASALVDALGADGRDVNAFTALCRALFPATFVGADKSRHAA